MPCFDERVLASNQALCKDSPDGPLSGKQLEAILCAILSANEELRINFQEAGVSEAALTHWWKDHQRRDAGRKGATDAA